MKCNQCNRPLPKGEKRKNHAACLARMRLHSKDRAAYLATRNPRQHLPETGSTTRVTLNLRSGNKKTGRIPVTLTAAATCPKACPLRGQGCYAEFGFLRHHWSNVPKRGMTWRAFCDAVRALPAGQLWRHAQAGDLPGRGDYLDDALLMQLVDANAAAGARGFAFTHKPLNEFDERVAVRVANQEGFTINLSAHGLVDADTKAEREIGPVATVVPRDFPKHGRTPAGRHVTVCPFETSGVKCSSCQLCAVPHRKTIVAFRAHGQFAEQVEAAL